MTKPFEQHNARFWLNFVALCSVLALSEVARGIVTPVLSLYTNELHGSPFMLSVIVAAFSIGRLIATFIYGVLTDRMSIRWILCSALLITIVGHILYIAAEYITTTHNEALIVLVIGRACSGAGTACLSSARAFVSKYTQTSERTFFFSALGIVQFVGFAGTPVLGGIYVNWSLGGGWIIDSYTFGTYLVLILDTILLFVIFFGLKDDEPTNTPAVKSTEQSSQRLLDISLDIADIPVIKSQRSHSVTLTSLPVIQRQRRHSSPAALHYQPAEEMPPSVHPTKNYSIIAAILFVVLNGTSRGCLAVAETYGADLYYQVQFGKDYTRDEVSTINEAWFYTGLGAIGMIVFLGMHKLTSWFSEVYLLITGFCCITIGFLSVVDPTGVCSFGALIFGMSLLYIVATPINNTLAASMLSKECRPEQAGLMMGWLTAAGSLGRILFPLMSGAFYSGFGLNGALIFPGVIGFLSAIAIVIVLKTYVTWLDSLRTLEHRIIQIVTGRQLVSTEDDDFDGWLTPEDVYQKQQQKTDAIRLLNLRRSSSDSEMVHCVLTNNHARKFDSYTRSY